MRLPPARPPACCALRSKEPLTSPSASQIRPNVAWSSAWRRIRELLVRAFFVSESIATIPATKCHNLSLLAASQQGSTSRLGCAMRHEQAGGEGIRAIRRQPSATFRFTVRRSETRMTVPRGLPPWPQLHEVEKPQRRSLAVGAWRLHRTQCSGLEMLCL
jgi:hypothetical protein